jgi:hypothetical protein
MRYRIRIKTGENNSHSSSTTDISNIIQMDSTINNETSFDYKTFNDYMFENWQLEIRKVTYDDTGLYQCSLPLVHPQYINITLKVIRKFFFL